MTESDPHPHPVLRAALEHFAPSGWPVALVCQGLADSYLEAHPWGPTERSLRLWGEGETVHAQLHQTARIEPVEDYLDPARRALMAQGVVGMLDGADEALRGYTAGSLAAAIAHDDEAHWRQVHTEGSAMHREIVRNVNEVMGERARLDVEDDGWIHAKADVPLPADGLDFTTFAALLGALLDIELIYRQRVRLAMFGGFSEARRVSRPSD